MCRSEAIEAGHRGHAVVPQTESSMHAAGLANKNRNRGKFLFGTVCPLLNIFVVRLWRSSGVIA